MKKSELYCQYRYAIKFENIKWTAYKRYLKWQYYESGLRTLKELPVGKVTNDSLGAVDNDFYYTDGLGDFGSANRITDGGSSRAFEVCLDDGNTKAVCVTHESGLELFLLAAGTFIGLEAAKYTLTRALELTEKRINHWFKDDEEFSRDNSYINRILVRTPYWEISIDGELGKEDRDTLFNFLEKQEFTKETIEEHLAELNDEPLKEKIASKTRYVSRENS
ncbi:MAG: hypothetical protein AAGI72_17765 [Pseudomonadota bacterium]